MTAPATPTGRARLDIALAGLLWSLGGVFIKAIALPAPLIACLRSLVAALALLPFVRRRPAPGYSLTAASIATYTGVVGLFVVSTKLTTAANAIILQYTAPAFVALFEFVFRGRRPHRLDALTLLGGMTGIAVIYLGAEPADLLGVALAVLSGALFAAWMVLAGAARDLDPTALTFANNLGAAVLLAPFAAATATGSPSLPSLAALAIMGTIQLALPYVLFSRGVRKVLPQEASLIVLVEPVLNPVWVALVIGEIPAPSTLGGGALILATLAARYLAPRRGRA